MPRPSSPTSRWELFIKASVASLALFGLVHLLQMAFCPNRQPGEPPIWCGIKVLRLGGLSQVKPMIGVEQLCESAVFDEVKKDLEHLVDSLQRVGAVKRAALHITGFNDGEWMAVNGNERFHPASLMKVPIMLSVLRRAEREPGLLSKKMKVGHLPPGYVENRYFPGPSVAPGQWRTVHELLASMIQYSDNLATHELLKLRAMDSTFFKSFDLPMPEGDDTRFTYTPKEYSVFFKSIYNVSYTGHEYSNYAAELLGQTSFKEGFVRGLPPGTRTWHKFGEWQHEGYDPELHESGFIYVNGTTPYLLTVMTSGNDTHRLASCIALICGRAHRGLSKVKAVAL